MLRHLQRVDQIVAAAQRAILIVEGRSSLQSTHYLKDAQNSRTVVTNLMIVALIAHPLLADLLPPPQVHCARAAVLVVQ